MMDTKMDTNTTDTTDTSEYALYAVPDNVNIFDPCESISFGINWKGPHITLCGFTKNNKYKILNVLSYIKYNINPTFKNNVHWNPLYENVKIIQYNYLFDSNTLKQITSFIKNYIEDVREDNFHIYNRLGINPDINILRKTSWSLMMIKKTGENVEWLHDTRVPLYLIK